MTKPPVLPSRPPSAPTHTARKTFSIVPCTGAGEGDKILIYGEQGMGKTTLAAMAPGAVFIPLDDGARKIKHPQTGKDLDAIPGVETFQDLRDALHQPKLMGKGRSLVIDTVQRAQLFAEHYVLQTVKNDRGESVGSLEEYGYGKGYMHLLDAMRLFISDLEPLVRAGVNIILLSQMGTIKVANLEGTDYMQEGPKLINYGTNALIRNEFLEWVDHVLRIAHPPVNVVKDNKKAVKGKATGSTERIIYSKKEVFFTAKTRKVDLPEQISFSEPADDSLWTFLFN